MAKNRLKAEQIIIKYVDMIDPSGRTKLMYEKDIFPNLNDQQFDKWMTDIRDSKDFVFVIDDNFAGSQISTKNNLKVAKELGVEFFQHLVLTDPATGITFKTPLKYLVIDVPVRRQIQSLVNKISIPEDNQHIDELTDQPTGISKGSALSQPEILALYSQGFDKTILEFIRYRGGDLKAMNFMDREIMQKGGVNMETIDKTVQSRAKASETLSILLKGMHFDNNL